MILGVEVIDDFSGNWEMFSNFYPVSIEYYDFVFPTVEHAFVAAKTNDRMFWRKISVMPASDAGKAKRMGRRIKLREDWEIIKISRMRGFLEQKFQFLKFREKLLSSGNALLVEGNYWHDNYWGDCKCKKCSDIIGLNHLGKLLMERRDIIK